jgi:predicted amidohydrolase YtcJ
MEGRIGSIEIGKHADIAILDGDVHSAMPQAIHDMPVWMTMLGGHVLWSMTNA